MDYQSIVRMESAAMPGVWFEVKRLSMAGRLELLRLVRQEVKQLEFYSAGEAIEDQLRARELSTSLDQLYLRWGLHQIGGLTIDGKEASGDLVLSHGPESLAIEIATAVRQECFLNEAEIKN